MYFNFQVILKANLAIHQIPNQTTGIAEKYLDPGVDSDTVDPSQQASLVKNLLMKL